MKPHLRTGGKGLSGSALLCLALASCNKTPQATEPVSGAPVAALQLATATPPPPSYAPPAASLPPAPQPVSYRPTSEHYRYLTDAYDMSDAFGDTPPDYTVEYDGESPYVWRADDGAYRVVEWMPDGARYYYYEPGADEPFLIQDPEYSYAYDNGVLVAVYTLAGALVADRLADQRRDYAARYYARGHDLYRAAVHDPRRAAYAANWRERAPAIQAQRTRWQQGREQQPAWRDWNRAHQAQQEARWAPERQHRRAYAAALQDRTAAQRGQRQPERTAQARPAPPSQPDIQHRPGASPNDNRPDFARRQNEAQRGPQPAPQQRNQPQHAPQPSAAQAERHGANGNGNGIGRHSDRTPQHQAAQASAQPRTLPQQRVAERQVAHAQQAQHHAAQLAQQQQHHEAQQAQQAQRHAAQQAQQAEHRQAQQAQQAQRAQAQATRQQQQRAQTQMQQHQQRQAAEAHSAAARAPHPASAPHAQPAHPQPSHPAPQQHDGGDKGGQQRDRHHS